MVLQADTYIYLLFIYPFYAYKPLLWVNRHRSYKEFSVLSQCYEMNKKQ